MFQKTVTILGFNSKLVRLEGVKMVTALSKMGRFNSKLVRLEVFNGRGIYQFTEVSIPNWFD